MILLITFLCFADDTSLYLVVDNEYEAADQLNKDIESIHQWSQKWLINSTLTKQNL
jgi:nitrogen fixation protein FixH